MLGEIGRAADKPGTLPGFSPNLVGATKGVATVDARYRKLYPRLWRHSGFVALDTLDKLITLYVLTGPQTNRIGCFLLSPGAASEDLAVPAGTFLKRLGNVCQTFGWTFHEASRVMLVTSWWNWNEPENANVLKGALKDAAELPDTPVYATFYECSRNVCQRLGVTLRERSLNVPETLPNSGSVTGTVQQQEQEHQQDGSPAVAVDDGFDEFWHAYPKKVGKGDAAKVWRQLGPNVNLRETIQAAIASQRSCRQWLKDGGQFIPNPATWLRQKRWGDEPDPDTPIYEPRTVAQPAPTWDFDWCQHEPRCNSRDWHSVLVEREHLAATRLSKGAPPSHEPREEHAINQMLISKAVERAALTEGA